MLPTCVSISVPVLTGLTAWWKPPRLRGRQLGPVSPRVALTWHHSEGCHSLAPIFSPQDIAYHKHPGITLPRLLALLPFSGGVRDLSPRHALCSSAQPAAPPRPAHQLYPLPQPRVLSVMRSVFYLPSRPCRHRAWHRTGVPYVIVE